jgi:hypothetical protein
MDAYAQAAWATKKIRVEDFGSDLKAPCKLATAVHDCSLL